MARDAVLSQAGKPKWSGWPENVVETWESPGRIYHYRLVVSYRADYDHPEEAVVDGVREGTWLRGYGWLDSRIEQQ